MDLSIEKLVFNLNTLAELGEEISSSKDFIRIVRSSLLMVMGSFSASRGIILKYSHGDGSFYPVASKGVSGVKGFRLKMKKESQKALFEINRPVDLKLDKDAAALLGPAFLDFEKFGARVIVPLVVKNEPQGFISIGEKFSGHDYSTYDMQLFSVMARHISYSLHSHTLFSRLVSKYNENVGLYDNLSKVYYDTIHAFAAAIDAKDAYTKGHSHRVSAYCAVLAAEMDWSKDDVEGIRLAGLLHDIGKIAVDKSIINKASPLTSLECRELNSHPVVGYEILSKIKFPWQGLPLMTRNHHEKVDGSGYPDRLERSEIPVGARLMALVDAFDAMTTDRPYRPRLTFKEAIGEIRKNNNKQFDPEVVRPFVGVIHKEMAGEVDHPSIVPLLQEHLEASEVESIIADFLQ